MEAVLLPSLIGSGEDSGDLEPVPLNSEVNHLNVDISESEIREDSESSNSMRADSPTISLEELELIAMVGGVVSGGGAMEKERIIAVIAIFVEVTQHLRMNCWQRRWKLCCFLL